MRSAALFQLAFGLLTVNSALGSPCKPTSVGTTTSITSAASQETGSATWTVSTALTDTSAPVELISSSTTNESSPEELTTSSTVIDTTLTTEMSISTNLDLITTTTASVDTTLAVPMPTFTILAVGQGSMEGRSLKTYPGANNVAVFDPPDNQGGFAAAPNPFTIDENGRLINNAGFFLCGFYPYTSFLLDAPAEVGTCSDEYELFRVFLHCKLDAGSKVRCEIPAISCTTEDPNDENAFPTCEKADGKWSTLSTRYTGPGHVLHIGPENSPSYYERLEIGIQEI